MLFCFGVGGTKEMAHVSSRLGILSIMLCLDVRTVPTEVIQRLLLTCILSSQYLY